jgi:hypothetical protein
MALGVQTTYANPGVVVAELRAMSCCAHHCDEPLSLPSARTCCGLTATASGPAEGPVVPGVPMLAPVAFTGAAGVLATVSPARERADVLWPAGSGPPAFLVHRHLLI